MPDDRAQRPPFRDRYQDRHGQRPAGAPSSRPSFGSRQGGAPSRPPFTPRPPHDAVTIRMRDGDREVEIHGSLAECRQLLDELPGLWARLRPQGAASTTGQPSIALPPPPAPRTEANAADRERPSAAARDSHRRDRHAGEPSSRPAHQADSAHAGNGAATRLEEEVVAILRSAGRPVGIAEIRSRLREDVSGQAVRRILERTQGVASVGGRPAAYRLR